MAVFANGTLAPMTTGASDTADTLRSVTGSGDDRTLGEAVTPARPVHPYIHVVVVAVIGAVSVLVWLAATRP